MGKTDVVLVFMHVELHGNKEVTNAIVVSKVAQMEKGNIHENNELHK